MRNNILIIFIVLIGLYLFSCGSGKGKIDVDNETPETLLEKAETAYQNNQYDDAIEISNLLLLHFPVSDLHIDAQLNIAKSLGGKEKFEDQLDLLSRLIKENKIPEKVPLIFMQIAQLYEHAAQWNPGNITSDSLDLERAAGYYRKAVFYPNSDDKTAKAKALYRAALLNAKLARVDIATRAYEQVVASFPESPYSTLAKIKLRNPSNTDEIDLESEAVVSLDEQRQEQLEIEAEKAAAEPEPEEEKVIEYPDEMPDREVSTIMNTTTQEDSVQMEIEDEQERSQDIEQETEQQSEEYEVEQEMESMPDESPIMEIPED